MAWRCEVWIARPMKGEPYWLVLDEERGTVGRRLMSRKRYEQAMLRSHPILKTREYRITEFDAPKIRTLFTMSVPLAR